MRSRILIYCWTNFKKKFRVFIVNLKVGRILEVNRIKDLGKIHATKDSTYTKI